MTPPLGECGRASFEVGLSVDEVAFLVEEVVQVGMGCGELRERPHLPKSQHRPLSWSEWQVRILDSVERGSEQSSRRARTPAAMRRISETGWAAWSSIWCPPPG
jgi:hypothetical protein